jgi:signal transduction histidine kinase
MRREVLLSMMENSEKTELRDAFHKLSHDIRSPLTSILGLAEITLDDPSLSDDARENLSMIVADAERLTEMAIKAIDEIDTKFFNESKGE